jgi:hypothetical protein
MAVAVYCLNCTPPGPDLPPEFWTVSSWETPVMIGRAGDEEAVKRSTFSQASI